MLRIEDVTRYALSVEKAPAWGGLAYQALAKQCKVAHSLLGGSCMHDPLDMEAQADMTAAISTFMQASQQPSFLSTANVSMAHSLACSCCMLRQTRQCNDVLRSSINNCLGICKLHLHIAYEMPEGGDVLLPG